MQGADDVFADGLSGSGGEGEDGDTRELLRNDTPQLLVLWPEICDQGSAMLKA